MNLSILGESTAAISKPVESTNISVSYFTEALKGISEIEQNNLAITQEFYKGILEAGDNPVLIVEASNGLIDGIKNIIDKFIALIKKIVAKFSTTLHKLVKSDKYLVKNKKKFEKFGSEHEFDMDIYTYTHIDTDTFPNTSAYNLYKSGDFSGVKNFTNGVEYTAAIYDDFVANLPQWYEKFRGVVLTDSGYTGDSISNATPYTSGEYADELRKKYRNNESSKTKTTITSVEVNQALTRFEGYKKTLEHVQKLQRDLEREYTAIKKDISNITAAYSDNDIKSAAGNYEVNFDVKKSGNKDTDTQKLVVSDYNDEAKKKQMDSALTKFIKAKATQVDQMCTIHSMAFTAKLDAIKEAYAQDKKVLYAALKKINKTYYKHESAIMEQEEPEPICMLDWEA